MKRHQITLLLSETELNQLHCYCSWAEDSQVYYGPVAPFKQRHKNITEQLEKALASLPRSA